MRHRLAREEEGEWRAEASLPALQDCLLIWLVWMLGSKGISAEVGGLSQRGD